MTDEQLQDDVKSDVAKSAVSMIHMSRDQRLRSLQHQHVWKKVSFLCTDTFSCPGYRIVEDRKIRCHKVGGHGQETFVQGIQNSCNPVFMDIGLRLGAEKFYDLF